MDRERLTELLQDPAQVAAEDLGDLRSMTERFPWFSGAHLLLAVGEHAQGDVLSNDPVRTPAAYLPSRAVLFDLTQAEASPAPPPMHVVKEIQPELPLPVSQHAATPAAVEASPTVTERPPFVAEGKKPMPDVQVEGEVLAPPAALNSQQHWASPLQAEELPPVSEGPLHLAEELRPILPDSANGITNAPLPHRILTPLPTLQEPDPLESQFREAIMANGYDLSAVPPPPEEPRIAAVLPSMASETERAIPPTVATRVPAAQPLQPVTRITKGSRLRFTDWLTASDAISSEPSIVTASGPSSEETPSAQALSPTAPLSNAVDPDPKEIIDRFIQQATPPAAPVKAEFFTPQQAAKRSLQDEGLVSETLAKIYEQQGDIAKAKATYARLSIIHPEKSVYFAALSKALEGRSNK